MGDGKDTAAPDWLELWAKTQGNLWASIKDPCPHGVEQGILCPPCLVRQIEDWQRRNLERPHA